MTTKFYADVDGKYLGGWDSGSDDMHPNVPEGAVEVSAPPASAAQVWDGEAWGAAPDAPYWETRKELYRERIAAYKGVPGASHLDVLGFVADAQIRAMAGDATELTEIGAIVAQVKSDVPKP